MRLIHSLLLLVLLGTLVHTAKGQDPTPLTADERIEVVESLSSILSRNYVFPEVADEMVTLIIEKLRNGEYDAVKSPREFGQILTEDLQSVSHDLHLRVNFAPEQVARMREIQSQPDSDEPDEQWVENLRFGNHGFQEVKILDGNVGYLDLRGFQEASLAGETAAAAMNFLANSGALIIDLRNNGGGSPSMIQLLTTYLYDENQEPIHLNNFYWRPTDEHTQTWTLPYVPGKRLGSDASVYVLTSGRTFSAAEEFTYNLKNLERATIVGETTGGGAHPGGTQIATDRFVVWVPSGRAINPITNTNWEGTGVTPHVEVPQEDALTKAHLMALKELAEEESMMQARYQWYIPVLESKLSPATPSAELLSSYAGEYGPRKLTYKDGQLWYSRDGNSPAPLIPLADDLFYLEDIPYFRLQIDTEDGEIKGVKGLYDNGREDYSVVSRA